MATCTVPIDNKHLLTASLRDGAVVDLNASTTLLQPDTGATLDNSSLNLISDNGDILLTMAFRRRNRTVILNSRPANGVWGNEEHFNFDESFTEGRTCDMSVALSGSKYLIIVEGSLRYTYAQRLDAPITGVGYMRNHDMTTAIFGDSIDVKVINALPPPGRPPQFYAFDLCSLDLDPTQYFPLSIGNTRTLDNPLSQNELIYFNSDTTFLTPDGGTGIDNTSLNLLSGSNDIILTISFRRSKNTIVFNACHTGGNWGREEAISSNGLFRENEPTSVVVFNGTSSFDIYIAGVYHYEFEKRFDEEVTGVKYVRNRGMTTQIFAETIDVTVDDM